MFISRPIAEALESIQPSLGCTSRDPRFVAQAKDEEAHCGYQQWHRDLDKEVVEWLETEKKATPEQFMRFLRKIYSRPDMKLRFPNGF